jgi:hypothetical protein
MKGSHSVIGGGVVIRVLITPRATALTRTPRDACSIASERVTAASPPLVRDVSAEGRSLDGSDTIVSVPAASSQR